MSASDDDSGQRPRSADMTRDRLLLAAVDLFAERGYAGVRARDIANRAGVTTGAIYAHYDDVASLLADAAGRAVDHAVEALAHVMPGQLGATLRAFMSSTSEHGLSREQSLLLEAFIAARRESRLRETLSEVLRSRLLVLERAVRDAQAAGELAPQLPPDALAWFLYLMPVGLLAGRAVDLSPPSAAASAQVLEAFFLGLSPTAGPGPA